MSQEFVAVQLSQVSRNVEKSKPTGVAAKVKIVSDQPQYGSTKTPVTLNELGNWLVLIDQF